MRTTSQDGTCGRCGLPTEERIQSSTDTSWDMSKEREFIENLLCQRINFFLVIFAALLAGGAAADNQIVALVVLWPGFLLLCALTAAIMRADDKLHLILDHSLFLEEGHPARIIELASRETTGGTRHSVRHLLGKSVPCACSALMGMVALAASFAPATWWQSTCG